MFVALAAASAACNHHFRFGIAEVGQQLFTIRPFNKNKRAHWQVQHHVFTFFAIALATLAGATIPGLVKALEPKIVQ